jgi:hypothetical protein
MKKTWKERFGITCPSCGSRHSLLKDSRPNREGDEIRRRRECENGHRFTTYERIDLDEQDVKPPTLKELSLELAQRVLEFSEQLNGE